MLYDANSYDSQADTPVLPKDLLEALAEYSEMTISENVFLYNIVKQAQPKKILEVGVAAGGSTLIFLEAIKSRDDVMFYSFDIADNYYKDIYKKRIQGIRPTGFLASELRPDLSHRVTSLRHSGGLAACLDEIGIGIDLCLLDTMHSTPGELIDFLCLLPYLADGGIVVLHDINLQLFHPPPLISDPIIPNPKLPAACFLMW